MTLKAAARTVQMFSLLGLVVFAWYTGSKRQGDACEPSLMGSLKPAWLMVVAFFVFLTPK